MKIQCKQADLIKALNIVSKAITSRTTIQTFKGILITAKEDNTLVLAATDLEISIETKMDAFVNLTGSILLPAKLFVNIVRKLPSDQISIEEKDNNNVEIKCNQSEFNIISFPLEEFPRIEIGDNGEKYRMDSFSFKEIIRKTFFIASIEEIRGVLTGILLEFKNNSLSMIALDGFRMAVLKEKITFNEEKDVIISAKIMNDISKIIIEDEDKEENGTFEIIIEENKAVFDLDKTKISVRLMDGKYMNYNELIPSSHEIDVILNRKELLDGIDRASLLIREGRNTFIKCSLEENNFLITSRSEEGNIKENINIEKVGPDLEIGFNAKFISDILKVIPDDKIKLEFNSATTPCIIKPLDGDSFLYLILPVRITPNY